MTNRASKNNHRHPVSTLGSRSSSKRCLLSPKLRRQAAECTLELVAGAPVERYKAHKDSGRTFGLQGLYNGLLAAFTIASVAWSMMSPRSSSKHILSTVISTPITHSLLAAHPRKRVRGFRVTKHDRTRQLERTCDLLLAEHLTKLVLRATVEGG